jgi:hypothetical protein
MDLGRLAPASEVAGGHTMLFSNWQTMPLCQTIKTRTLGNTKDEKQ